MFEKTYWIIDTIAGWLLPTAHAQLSSSTILTLAQNTRDEGFNGLQTILPLLFGAGITVALAILVYRWIKGMVSGPR